MEVRSHYNDLLGAHYSWIAGGHETMVPAALEFFQKHLAQPHKNALALDLGCGSGFQSIPLAQMGFRVKAIDFCPGLLRELRESTGNLPITLIHGDFTDVENWGNEPYDLMVCMGDTLTHLSSSDCIVALLRNAHALLRPGGMLIISFREQHNELYDLDRFIPVRSDDNRIFTCFLEYEPETVKVYDLLYLRNGSGWELKKSFYRKLRISGEWLEKQLAEVGFTIKSSETIRGMRTIIAHL